MKTKLTYKIFQTTAGLPESWDQIADDKIFLTKPYLEILERSAPENMQCYFIGYFDGTGLAGVGISQFLDVNRLRSFGERDKCFRTFVRNFIFRNYCSHVLFMGNNMLTGQNAIRFGGHVAMEDGMAALRQVSDELIKLYRKMGKPVHLVSFKDFPETMSGSFEKAGYQKYFRFSTQPNMVMPLRKEWKSEQDYIGSMSKKYRDQYKRARKKSAGLDKRKFGVSEIMQYEDEIYALYSHVAMNAPFNTFFLARTHFRVMKELLKDKFKFYAYFDDGRLVGFSTLILNGKIMDTYFLGYDHTVQKERMLYLNMLYDMISYSIKKGFEEIVFARTALEIKSSVGAEPQNMIGYMKHTNPAINRFLPRLFSYLQPNITWQQRHPFRNEESSDTVL